MNNLCCSNPTSGSNFFKKPNSMGNCCEKSIIVGQAKNLERPEYPDEKYCRVKHRASSGCSILQPLKKTIYRGA